jgi:hypothetical protein
MEVWEKFNFQPPDCFNSICLRVHTRVIMDEKKPLLCRPFFHHVALTIFYKFQMLERLLVIKKRTEHSSLFYNGAIRKGCCQL